MNRDVDQAKLCNRLQLLNLLSPAGLHLEQRARCSDVFCPPFPKTCQPGTKATRLLDTLAACLDSGAEGEAIAVSLDTRQYPPKLALASSSQDDEKVHQLLQLLTRKDVTGYHQVFPFLLRHCSKALQRRITKLHQSITSHNPDFSSYEFQALKVEFPAHHLLSSSDQPVSEVYRQVFTDLEQSSNITLVSDEDPQAALEAYDKLLTPCLILVNSRFIKQHNKFKRRLEKVIQYGPGITALIADVHRRHPSGVPLQYHWISPPTTPLPPIVANTWQDTLKGLGYTFPEAHYDLLLTRFPDLAQWQETYYPQLHPELAIIQYFDSSPHDQHSHGAIGSNKQSCWCCEDWIDGYNGQHETKWVTSGYDSEKSDPNWAIPPGNEFSARLVNGRVVILLGDFSDSLNEGS